MNLTSEPLTSEPLTLAPALCPVVRDIGRDVDTQITRTLTADPTDPGSEQMLYFLAELASLRAAAATSCR